MALNLRSSRPGIATLNQNSCEREAPTRSVREEHCALMRRDETSSRARLAAPYLSTPKPSCAGLPDSRPHRPASEAEWFRGKLPRLLPTHKGRRSPERSWDDANVNMSTVGGRSITWTDYLEVRRREAAHAKATVPKRALSYRRSPGVFQTFNRSSASPPLMSAFACSRRPSISWRSASGRSIASRSTTANHS